jgi:Fe2+ transport system protein B
MKILMEETKMSKISSFLKFKKKKKKKTEHLLTPGQIGVFIFFFFFFFFFLIMINLYFINFYKGIRNISLFLQMDLTQNPNGKGRTIRGVGGQKSSQKF